MSWLEKKVEVVDCWSGGGVKVGIVKKWIACVREIVKTRFLLTILKVGLLAAE